MKTEVENMLSEIKQEVGTLAQTNMKEHNLRHLDWLDCQLTGLERLFKRLDWEKERMATVNVRGDIGLVKRKSYGTLESLIERCNKYLGPGKNYVSNRKEFRNIIQDFTAIIKDTTKIADKLDVPVPTVKRWRRGKRAPVSGMRPKFVEMVKEECKDMKDEIDEYFSNIDIDEE